MGAQLERLAAGAFQHLPIAGQLLFRVPQGFRYRRQRAQLRPGFRRQLGAGEPDRCAGQGEAGHHCHGSALQVVSPSSRKGVFFNKSL
jgi:hypothetical protein